MHNIVQGFGRIYDQLDLAIDSKKYIYAELIIISTISNLKLFLGL